MSTAPAAKRLTVRQFILAEVALGMETTVAKVEAMDLTILTPESRGLFTSQLRAKMIAAGYAFKNEVILVPIGHIEGIIQAFEADETRPTVRQVIINWIARQMNQTSEEVKAMDLTKHTPENLLVFIDQVWQELQRNDYRFPPMAHIGQTSNVEGIIQAFEAAVVE